MKRNPTQAPATNSNPRALAQGGPAIRQLASHNGETLVQYPDGSFAIRFMERQYFDGKRWRAGHDVATLEGVGINSDRDPRLREMRSEKPLSPDQARKWITRNLVPWQVAPWFAAPLMGADGNVPCTKPRLVRIAARSGVTPDALVCHAVEVFLDYVEEFPEEAGAIPMIEPENVAFFEARKFAPSPAAKALFERLYKEAIESPFNAGLAKLAALRDLISTHPAFVCEHQAICSLIASSSALAHMPSAGPQSAAA